MESFVITWRELLIVVAVVLAIYVAELLLLLRSGKSGERWFSRGGATQDKAALVRLENLEAEIAELRQHVARLESGTDHAERPAEPVHAVQTPYGQAIQMARTGLDAEAVASACGISRGEAELIVAMHGIRAS